MSVYAQCLDAVHTGGALIASRTIGALPLEEPGKPIDRDVLIADYVAKHVLTHWVAIDDLEQIERLPAGHWFRTDGRVGLTWHDADRIIELFRQQGAQ